MDLEDLTRQLRVVDQRVIALELSRTPRVTPRGLSLKDFKSIPSDFLVNLINRGFFKDDKLLLESIFKLNS